jgi:glycosyltransferase involved in cell wall biosynthesis
MAALRSWFRRNRVDLAYVSMLKHDAYVVVGEARRQGFPVVLRPEGAGATGDIAWQGWGRFGGRIARRCRQADAVVAISQAIRDELAADGYHPARIHELPNGVPVPEVPWAPPPRTGSGLRGIFIGRLAPEKGLDVLVEAWAQVVRERPEARLRILGEGPARATLEEQVARRGLQTAVEMPGASGNPMPDLRASDVFVLPSREEGMSIALLEAMALGMPVITTAIPGNQALIVNGLHGLLAPPGDAATLAARILAVGAEPESARRRAEEARRRVREHYSIAAVARRHLMLFEGLVRERRRACDGGAEAGTP